MPFFKEPPYGLDLAERVAALLDSGGRIADVHAYYCGTGFMLVDGRYVEGRLQIPGRRRMMRDAR